jgi:hypothetical protein
MSRFALIAALAAATTLSAQQADESFEVEPAILPQNLKSDSAARPDASASPNVDLAQLERNLERARKSAGSAERLYKIGALAKIEAEARVLKVVRLESELENARLARAKEDALSSPAPPTPGQSDNLQKPDGDLAHAIQAAHTAAAKREQAELEAAEMNLFRQQKLLALGSGSKASVRRAEQKLTELKTQKD